jgi:hypothetical protein
VFHFQRWLLENESGLLQSGLPLFAVLDRLVLATTQFLMMRMLFVALLVVVVVVAAAGVIVAMFDTAAIIANVNRVATGAAMTQLLFFLLIRCISVPSTIAIDKRLPL